MTARIIAIILLVTFSFHTYAQQQDGEHFVLRADGIYEMKSPLEFSGGIKAYLRMHSQRFRNANGEECLLSIRLLNPLKKGNEKLLLCVTLGDPININGQEMSASEYLAVIDQQEKSVIFPVNMPMCEMAMKVERIGVELVKPDGKHIDMKFTSDHKVDFFLFLAEITGLFDTTGDDDYGY